MKPTNSSSRTVRILTGLALALAAFTFVPPTARAADTLIGHWISGPSSLTDSSGFTPTGTHDGVAVGANAALLAWTNDLPAAGFTGQSLNLKAGSVGVLITNSAMTDPNYQTTFDVGISNRFSVAFWMKLSGTTGGDFISKSGNTPKGWRARTLTVNGQPSTNLYVDFTMRSNPTETDVVSVGGFRSANGNSNIEATNIVNDGVWHHVVEVFDGTVAYRKIYVDGVLRHYATSIPYLVTYGVITNHLMLGANQDNIGSAPGGFFPGLLFDARVYNYPISSGEVQYLITAGQISSKDIFTFNFPGLSATTISDTNITITVPFTTDITALSPTYLCSALATCSPPSGTTRNFTSPQTYTVTAQDSSTKTYLVTVTKSIPSSACDILSVNWGAYSSVILGTNISLLVPAGTAVTALNPTVTISPFASVSPASGSTHDFTSPVNYTVTAEDGVSTKTYAVGVLPQYSWTNSTGGAWSVGGNWNPNSVPASANTTALAFNTGGTYSSTNDLGDGFQLNLLLFGAPNLTLNGNSLQFVGINPQVLNISLVSVVVSNSLDLSVDTDFINVGGVTLSGVVSGAGALVKNGAGTLSLSGANTYAGGTVVNSGILSLAIVNGVLGTGPLTFNSGTTLFVNANTITNAMTLNGALVSNGNSFAANLNGPVTLAATTTFDQGTGGGMKIGGNVSGPGGLTKNGGSVSGPLILSGTNTYTGPTTVTAGGLRCNNVDALGSGALNISAGTLVYLNYTGDHSITSLTIAGTTMPNGNYGSPTSGADITSSYFTNSGTLTVGPHIQALIKTFTFPGQAAPTIDQTNHTISLTVPSATPVTALAPTYTTSLYTSSTPASGTQLNFTTPQTYTVVSGDSTVTNVYTVTVIVPPSPIPTVSGITGPVAGNFSIVGSANIAGNIVVEQATSLTPPVIWVPLQTNAVSAGAFSIGIPQGADTSAFYRLMGQ